MSRAARKQLINQLSNHPGNTDIALRNYLLSLIDSKTDIEKEAKAFYAPKKKKKVAKKKTTKKKVVKKRSKKRG